MKNRILLLPVLLLANALCAATALADDAADLTWIAQRGTGSEQSRRARAPHEVGTPRTSAQLDVLAAAREGQWEQVKKHLEQGLSASQTDERGNSLLLIASAQGHIDAVRLLLDRRADLQWHGPEGFDALGLSILRGHAQIARLLLRSGADPESRSANGDTPLLAAVRFDRAEILRELMARQARTKVFDRNGFSPLVLAAGLGHERSVLALLAAGVDPELKDRHGRTAAAYAATRQQHECARLILERGGRHESTQELTHESMPKSRQASLDVSRYN